MKRTLMLVPVLLILLGVSTIPAQPGIPSNSSQTGDRVGILQNVQIDSSNTGNIVVVLGDITVNNTVNGDVVSILGNVTVNAGVNGDVVSIVGTVTLNQRVEVNGNVVAVGGITKYPGAVVRGQEIGMGFGDFGENEDAVQKLSRMLFILLMFSGVVGLILGLIFIAAGRMRFTRMAASVQYEFAKKFSVGVLLLFAIPFAFILSVITVVGPPLILIFARLAQFTGFVAFSIYLGRSVFSFFKTEMNIYLEYVTGMLLLLIVNAAIYLMAPYTGITGALILYLLYSLFIQSVGLGTIAVSRFGSERMKSAAEETEFQRTRFAAEALNFDDSYDGGEAGIGTDKGDSSEIEKPLDSQKSGPRDGKEVDTVEEKR